MKFDYRKFYEREIGTKVAPHFHIHHLNLIKSDNDISNLVAIPRGLHMRYHRLLTNYNSYIQMINGKLCSPINSGIDGYDMDRTANAAFLDAFVKLNECKKECYKYIAIRNQQILSKYS